MEHYILILAFTFNQVLQNLCNSERSSWEMYGMEHACPASISSSQLTRPCHQRIELLNINTEFIRLFDVLKKHFTERFVQQTLQWKRGFNKDFHMQNKVQVLGWYDKPLQTIQYLQLSVWDPQTLAALPMSGKRISFRINNFSGSTLFLEQFTV